MRIWSWHHPIGILFTNVICSLHTYDKLLGQKTKSVQLAHSAQQLWAIEWTNQIDASTSYKLVCAFNQFEKY